MTQHKNNQSNSTISYSKFEFSTICAGVLFLVNHPMHIDRLHPFLIPSSFFFGDDTLQVKALRILVSTILEIRKRDGLSAIDAVYFQAKLNQMIDGEDSFAAQSLFNSMVSDPLMISKSQSLGCQKIFTDFLKANEIMKWAEKFTPKWKSGEMGEATQSMKELTSDLDKIKFSVAEEIIDIIKLPTPEMLDYLSVPKTKNKDLFLLGNTGLDDAIGGFERRALHIFIGPTNSGKSMMSHHLISQAIEQEMYVHIAVVEDRPKSFMRRLVANLAGVEINAIKFLSDKFTSQQIKDIDRAKELINKYVKIDFAYDDSLEMIHQRKSEYDSERESKGLPPYDVDIVDYSGHIATKSTGDKMYEKYRNAFAERKNFCLLHNKIGFDFAQLNREGFKKKESELSVNHGDLAGAYDLSQVCDNIIALYRTPKHEQNNDICLVITKVKDGELSRDGYLVGTDFKCARWNMKKYGGAKAIDVESTMKMANAASTIRIADDTKDKTL